MMKRGLSLAVVLLAVSGVLFGCKEEKPKPVVVPEVAVMTINPMDIFQAATMIAQVKADDAVDLVARVKGELRKRNFSDGQRVKKGDLLLEIEPELYQAELKQAEGVYNQRLAALKNARQEFERQEKLLNKDATSERNFEAVANRKLEAEAALQQAQAEVDKAKLNLSYTKIAAPFDGQAGFCRFSEGNVVGPESGTLINVTKNDRVRVEFVVPERLYVDLLTQHRPDSKSEDELRVELIFENGLKYEKIGRVTFWDNQVNATTGTFKLQAVFANPEHILISGLFVRVRLVPLKPLTMLMVPEEAVQLDQSSRYLYVLDKDNLIKRIDIKVGYRENNLIQVTEGLTPGAVVVVNGMQRIRSGIKVKPEPVSYQDGRLVKEPPAAALELDASTEKTMSSESEVKQEKIDNAK
ncbi:MAG: efflux RND transporter periplasmic adaptor subunit [Victivallaceae bacterium]